MTYTVQNWHQGAHTNLSISDIGGLRAMDDAISSSAGLGYTPVNKAGDTMTGDLSLGSHNLTVVGDILFGTTSDPFSNNGPKVHIRQDWTGTETSANRNVINVYSQAKGAWNTSHFLYQYESRWTDASSVVEKTVSGAANNGSGLIRITTSTAHGYATGDRIIVDSVGGTTEANGSWIATVIDTTHFDLQGSTFTNAYTSGGITSNRAGGAVFLGLVAPSLRRGGYSATNAHADDLAIFFGGNNGTRKATDLIYGSHTTFDDVGGTFLDEVEFDTCASFDNTATYGILLNGLYTGQSVRASHYGSGTVPEFQGRMARGIFDSPLRTKSGDILLRLSGVPAVAASDVAAASFAGATTRIDFIANEDQSNTNQGSRMVFYTTPLTTAAVREAFRIPNADGIDFTSSTLTSYAIRFNAANAHMTFGTTNGTKIGTATNELFAFWNATPAAQQVLATGAGKTVDNVISFLQSIGLCRQS